MEPTSTLPAPPANPAGPPSAPGGPSAAPASAPDLTRQMQGVATDAFARLADLARTLGDVAGRSADGGQAVLREHPAPALAGAFALGLVVGLLTSRR